MNAFLIRAQVFPTQEGSMIWSRFEGTGEEEYARIDWTFDKSPTHGFHYYDLGFRFIVDANLPGVDRGEGWDISMMHRIYSNMTPFNYYWAPIQPIRSRC